MKRFQKSGLIAVAVLSMAFWACSSTAPTADTTVSEQGTSGNNKITTEGSIETQAAGVNTGFHEAAPETGATTVTRTTTVTTPVITTETTTVDTTTTTEVETPMTSSTTISEQKQEETTTTRRRMSKD
jgi:hypothetical protein